MVRFSRILPSLAILATFGAANSAFAGYNAIGSGGSGYTDTNGNGLSVGDTFSLSNIALIFAGNTPNDPTTGLTIPPNYRLTFTSTITSAASGFGTSTASGTYRIYFDQNANGLFDENLIASSGTAAFSATASITGTLTPTSGPNSPLVTDIDTRYGFNPIRFSYGSFAFGNAFDQGGTLVLNQSATASVTPPVPEPASMAALGLGALGLLRRRRSRRS